MKNSTKKALMTTGVAFIIIAIAISVGAQTVSTTQAPVCPIVKSVLKEGWNNNTGDVVRLQMFLRDSEHMNIDVNGIYDTKTVAAVTSFQEKYASEILAPWGVKQGNGVVSLTTGKKLNQLGCGVALTMNGSDMAYIQKYKAGGTTGAVTITPPGTEVYPATDTGAGADIPEETFYDQGASAALGGGTMIQRFWVFFKGLF